MGPDIAGAEVWPKRVPDIYAGEPVVVAARLGTIAGDLRISGTKADASWNSDIPLETAAVPSNLPAGWRGELVLGSMPVGGTAGRLHRLMALVLLLSGIALRWMKGGSR